MVPGPLGPPAHRPGWPLSPALRGPRGDAATGAEGPRETTDREMPGARRHGRVMWLSTPRRSRVGRPDWRIHHGKTQEEGPRRRGRLRRRQVVPLGLRRRRRRRGRPQRAGRQPARVPSGGAGFALVCFTPLLARIRRQGRRRAGSSARHNRAAYVCTCFFVFACCRASCCRC